MKRKLKTKDLRLKGVPKPLVIIGLLLFLLIIIASRSLNSLNLTRKSTNVSKYAKTQVTPTKVPFEVPTGDKIQISEVELPNFYKSSSTINDNGDQLLSESEEFTILFFPQSQQFLISITSSPFSQVRTEAEKEFLKALQIDEEAACKLTVLITTPRFVNPGEAGKEYRLSFCE